MNRAAFCEVVLDYVQYQLPKGITKHAPWHGQSRETQLQTPKPFRAIVSPAEPGWCWLNYQNHQVNRTGAPGRNLGERQIYHY